jgi:hypothetical protein
MSDVTHEIYLLDKVLESGHLVMQPRSQVLDVFERRSESLKRVSTLMFGKQFVNVDQKLLACNPTVVHVR